MSDLISRQAAIEKLTNNLTYMHTFGADRSIDLIEELPSVEAEPVRHGHWKIKKASIHPYGNDVCCSECGHTMGSSFGYKFCPMCGAKMDGEQDG